MKRWQLAGVLLSGVLASFWANRTVTAQQPDPGSVIAPETTPELGVGKMNYDAYCASCHGMNAVGTDKGPTFLHRVYHPGHHSDKAFLVAPRQGARAHHWKFGDMMPVEKVTDAQLETIVKYVRALQKANGVF
jgi:mono/diheme cytochrome c family protein